MKHKSYNCDEIEKLFFIFVYFLIFSQPPSQPTPHFLWYIWNGRDSYINSHIFNFRAGSRTKGILYSALFGE